MVILSKGKVMRINLKEKTMLKVGKMKTWV